MQKWNVRKKENLQLNICIFCARKDFFPIVNKIFGYLRDTQQKSFIINLNDIKLFQFSCDIWCMLTHIMCRSKGYRSLCNFMVSLLAIKISNDFRLLLNEISYFQLNSERQLKGSKWIFEISNTIQLRYYTKSYLTSGILDKRIKKRENSK